MRIVLASGSPSRLKLLRSGGIEPIVDPADVDETAIRHTLAEQPPTQVVAQLARAKAVTVASRHPQDVVIGADSMLLLDGQLQGKPHSYEATCQRWAYQAGRTATLLTGHCVIGPSGSEITDTIETAVHFASADPRDIAAYAATGEPLECAGAFTLEALGGWFIDRIDGDPSSVIGLSLPCVRRAIYSLGFTVSDFWE